MCELGEFAKMQFNLIRISCEFHACSEFSFKSIWSRYRSDRTEFQARASIRSGDPLWPRVISAKKAFHASTDDAGAAEMYANQLSISLCAFILFGQRPTTWHGISRCKGNALDMPNRFQFIHFLQALAHSFIHHAGNSKRCFRTVKADTT